MEFSFVFGASAIGVAFAMFLTRQILSKSNGTTEMQKVSDAIKEGAEAFLSRQNRTIFYLAILTATLIFILYGFARATNEHDPVTNPVQLGLWIMLSFLLGAACSVVSGYIGMWIAIRTNIRTAAGALTSLNEALVIALRGGAATGFLVVTLCILGIAGLFTVINAVGATSVEKIPLLIAGFGFGASFVALFAQLGGGIYTKPLMWAQTLSAKLKPAFPKMTHATPP
jgi:K(+)-stimulated pyrophosphate-energized sodium pump